MKDCILGIYWSARKETIDECTKKIFQTFTYLRNVDNSFVQWYLTKKPRKGELVTPIETDIDSIKDLLLKGRNFNDIGELLEDLGYVISLKSFKDFSKSHVLSFSCGIFNERLTNSVVLEFSKANEYNHLVNKSRLLSTYRKLVELWNPERGVIKCQDEDVPVLSEFYN